MGVAQPRSRAAEQRDELTTLQLIEEHSVPSQGRMAGYPISKDQSGGVRLAYKELRRVHWSKEASGFRCAFPYWSPPVKLIRYWSRWIMNAMMEAIIR